MAKNTRGRPTKYKKLFAKKIIEYFDIEPTQVLTEKFTSKNGVVSERNVIVAADFVTFEGFANSIEVDTDTVVEWANGRWPSDHPDPELRNQLKHPDFSVAYARAKQLQENLWATNSMNGRYNAQFAIFYGKNIYRDRFSDKSELDVQSGGKPLTIAVVDYSDAMKQIEAKKQLSLPKPK